MIRCDLLLLLALASSTLAAGAPPTLRLPATIRPSHYSVDLTLDPDKDSFTGKIDIELQFKESASEIWLNGSELKIGETSLDVGGKPVAITNLPGSPGFVGFQAAEPVPAGKATLHISYEAKVSSQDVTGVFREKSGDDWYLFTQFEAVDARRAFPCFDEPAFKVPWQFTLHVRAGQVALSNTPIVSETGEADNQKKVVFAETKPLPSYLTAWAVGPFETVVAGKEGHKGTPIRIVVPKGMKPEAHYAAASTGQLLGILEKYFGSPYPYEKLDNLSVPRFFGAMENPGLITYSESVMLAKSSEESIGFQQNYAIFAAHEMAHQWFGGLVTMNWWDDTWLNEAFASWMETKITGEWQPGWDTRSDEVLNSIGARNLDSLVTARKIRQPIESTDDIENAFDGITYVKGAAVISMFERYAGPRAFQHGVQQYMAKYANRNATAAEFLASISTAAGRDLGPAFSSFLDQTGVPLVDVKLQCGATPKILLTQQRYLPVGSTGPADQRWLVPVCLKYGNSSGGRRVCTVVSKETRELPLQGKTCPTWVFGNEQASGYYWVSESKAALRSLLEVARQQLSLPERLELTAEIRSLVAAGKMPASDAVELLPFVVADNDRHAITEDIDLLETLRKSSPEAALPAYHRLVLRNFGDRALNLGWEPHQGEGDETRLLRRVLVPFVADQGESARLISEAKRLANLWLDNPASIDSEMAAPILRTAARFGDRTTFDHLLAALEKTKTPRDRDRIVVAMSSFRDPAILQAALSLSLTDKFDPRETAAILRVGNGTAEQTVVFDFVRDNYAALVAKLPRDLSGSLPFAMAGFCDANHETQVGEFFKEKVDKLPGGPRNLQQAQESIHLCTALRDNQSASMERALKGF